MTCGPDDDQTRSFTALTAGTIVSHYKIISKIGAGGMGEVYLAEDTQLDRKVALKFLPPHLSQDESARARFTREAKAAAKLDHPNIVQVFEVGEYQGRPFFTMAHVDGRSLREVIKEGKLSVNEAIKFTKQICEGLYKAHESGIVHRDIKPGNIIIDRDNKARILDFGLATVAGEDKLTKTGSTMGTVGYMSPEQIEGKNVDHRSDLFSVGVILYEMLTGRRPFAGDTDAAVARSITDTAPEPIARYKSGTTGELQQIVDKALSKDPTLRYQHADGMLSELKRLEVGSASTNKSRLGLWAAVASLVVIAAGYFALNQFMSTGHNISEDWTNSVAVLVFRDLSPDRDQDYFCEGMTEEIIGRLTAIRQLKVTSTQSMLGFKGSDLDLKEIGRRLKVSNILEGSVQRVGETIRVRAQLVRVDDDAHLWSERYEHEVADLADIFDIQDEISRAIAGVMRVTLVESGGELTGKRGTDDLEAYNAYLQGRYFWRKRAATHLRTSIEHFNRAIEIDPDFALAYSGLSDAWLTLVSYGISSPVEENDAIARAEAAATKALQLNENLAEAQASRAHLYKRDYSQPGGSDTDLANAEKGYLRAIELNPGYVWSHLWYANLLSQAGRHEEWKAELMTAYELDPLAPVVLGNLAGYYNYYGDQEKAKELYLQIIEIEPSFPPAYQWMAETYAAQGKHDSALAMAEKYAEVCPETFYRPVSIKAIVLGRAGRLAEADSLYRRAIELAPERAGPCADYGLFLDNTQRWASAIQHFERATQLGSNNPKVHYRYGWLLAAEFGQFEEGLMHLLRAIDLNPRYVRAYNSLAYVYNLLGKNDSAIWAVNTGIEIAPNDYYLGTLLDTRGEINGSMGNFDSAVKDYRRALEFFPEDQGTTQNIGNIYIFMQDYERADSVFLSMAQSTNIHTSAWGRYYRVRVLTHQGRFREAVTLLQEGIERDIADLGAEIQLLLKCYQLGTIYSVYLGEQEMAIEWFLRTDSIHHVGEVASPFWSTALNGARAWSLAKLDQFDVAHALLDSCRATIMDNDQRLLNVYSGFLGRVLREEGNYDSAVLLAEAEADGVDWRNQFRIYRTLGVTYVAAGRYDDAIPTLEKALSRYDNNRFGFPDRSVTAHYFLGQAYEGAGRTREAIKQYEIFLDIWRNADEGLKPVEDAKERLARLKASI